MRKLIFILFALITTSNTKAQNTLRKIDEHTVVQDSSGTVYPYQVWQNLVSKGDYKLMPVNPKDEQTTFILIKRTEREKAVLMDKLPKPRASDYFKEGQAFSPFKTKDIDGNKIDLKTMTGKVIVLNFWFINCGPCRREIPQLNEMVEQFKTNDKVMFIAVALDNRYSIKEFLKTTPFQYSIVDDGRYLADKYGIRSYPTHVIVDTEGKVYFHTTGLAMNTVHWLKKSITELLKQDISTPAPGGE